MTELERIQLLYKEALPAKIGKRDGNPMVCWSPIETNSSKHEQNIYSEANRKYVWTLIYSLGEQEHAFLAVHHISSKLLGLPTSLPALKFNLHDTA